MKLSHGYLFVKGLKNPKGGGKGDKCISYLSLLFPVGTEVLKSRPALYIVTVCHMALSEFGENHLHVSQGKL